MRAVVLDDTGQPVLADVAEPEGDGDVVRVRACGLCGSDVEKLGKRSGVASADAIDRGLRMERTAGTEARNR